MLYHHGYNESKVSLKTRNVRATHELTRNCLPTLQVWSWDEQEWLPEGDAIIVASGGSGAYAVMRLGDKVGVYDCPDGINGAMKRAGLPRPEMEPEDHRLYRRCEELEDMVTQLTARKERLVGLLARARDLLSDSNAYACEELAEEIDKAIR